jgi:hypothetical protein
MRGSTAVLALSCLVAGYALVGTRAAASEDPARRFPAGIGVGARVTLWFSSDLGSVACTVDRIDSGWIHCATPEDPFNKQDEIWYDLGHVVSITKREPAR